MHFRLSVCLNLGPKRMLRFASAKIQGPRDLKGACYPG